MYRNLNEQPSTEKLVDIIVIEVQTEPSELEETKLGHKHISIPLPIILLD
jgi:hypothetical protein